MNDYFICYNCHRAVYFYGVNGTPVYAYCLHCGTRNYCEQSADHGHYWISGPVHDESVPHNGPGILPDVRFNDTALRDRPDPATRILFGNHYDIDPTAEDSDRDHSDVDGDNLVAGGNVGPSVYDSARANYDRGYRDGAAACIYAICNHVTGDW